MGVGSGRIGDARLGRSLGCAGWCGLDRLG